MVRSVDFNALRNNAKKVETKPGKPSDVRFYKLERNEDGNAFAIVRFLPQVEGEDTYYAMNYSHFFTENNKTYSEMCPTSIGEPCPVCECNRDGWKTTYGDMEKKRKRKARYVTNILVVKDKDHSEREGKVFLYEYGEKIHKKISNMIYDNDEEGTKGYNVFDFKTGKNFKLKIKTVSDYANYDDSEFVSDSSPIGNEQRMNEVDKQIMPLKEFIPTKETLKSYDELKSIFLSKINGAAPSSPVTETVSTAKPSQTRREEKPDAEIFETDNKKSDTQKEEDFFTET